MLRPKSALFYIDEITGVSDDLLDLMVGGGTSDKKIVPDVSPFLYRWSLEAVCAIFLDTRFMYRSGGQRWTIDADRPACI